MNVTSMATMAQQLEGKEAYTDLSTVQAIRSMKDKDLALEKIAQQFESMMMRMMTKSMRAANAVFEEGNFLSSPEMGMYRDMLDDQMALTLSQSGGMGIADVMVRQLKGRYGHHDRGVSGKVEAVSDYLNHRNNYQGPLPTGASAEVAAVSAPKFDGSVDRFVEELYPAAEQAASNLGVDVEVLLAQSALETGWGRKLSCNNDGNSSLNFFNIKADQRWQGDSVSVSTLEFRKGVPVREFADFRAYQSVQHSFSDYVEFIGNSSRYESALQSEDAESYIRKLAEAGYATDSRYAEKVIRIMNSDEMKSAVAKAASKVSSES